MDVRCAMAGGLGTARSGWETDRLAGSLEALPSLLAPLLAPCGHHTPNAPSFLPLTRTGPNQIVTCMAFAGFTQRYPLASLFLLQHPSDPQRCATSSQATNNPSTTNLFALAPKPAGSLFAGPSPLGPGGPPSHSAPLFGLTTTQPAPAAPTQPFGAFGQQSAQPASTFGLNTTQSLALGPYLAPQ
jgi:hypothetical protein